MKKFFLKIWIRRIYKKYRNALPETSACSNPKMEYHPLADAVVWEDEGLRTCDPDLENAFREVIYYRTSVIIGEPEEKYRHSFDLAKKYFPNWIGFADERCAYNPAHADNIRRMRKVAEWKVNKLLAEDEMRDA